VKKRKLGVSEDTTIIRKVKRKERRDTQGKKGRELGGKIRRPWEMDIESRNQRNHGRKGETFKEEARRGKKIRIWTTNGSWGGVHRTKPLRRETVRIIMRFLG